MKLGNSLPPIISVIAFLVSSAAGQTAPPASAPSCTLTVSKEIYVVPNAFQYLTEIFSDL
jgi:hypothetical protein